MKTFSNVGATPTVLLMLLFLSYPVSVLAGGFVAVIGPVAGVFANRAETPADFVLTLLWWFGAGYLQWFLLMRLMHGVARSFRRRFHPPAHKSSGSESVARGSL